MTTDKKEAASSTPLAARIEKTRTRQKSYVMDLRVQSPASMGYLGVEGLDSAPAIVRLAKVKGLDVIAITDFYSGEFIDRMVAAAKGSPLTVIPGVSVRATVGACSDVTISCLFPENVTGGQIQEFLRSMSVPVEARGNPNYVLPVSLDVLLKAITELHGTAIPSRLDKTPHRMSIIPELVERYGFRAFDLAYADSTEYFKKKWPKIKFQLFTFSDANALAQIGSRIAKVKLPTPGFEGIREIVSRQQG
jgi:hypothetical protein